MSTATPLSVTSVSLPAHGAAVIYANGTIRYTPAANYNGGDSFTYTISDGHGGTATGTVNVTVTAVNDAPVAANDSYSTDEETVLTVAAPGVLANDTDVENDALTAIVMSGPAHGTLTLNANGQLHLHAGRELHRQRQLHLQGERRHAQLLRGNGCPHGRLREPRAGRGR